MELKQKYDYYLKNRKTKGEPYKYNGFAKLISILHLSLDETLIREKKGSWWDRGVIKHLTPREIRQVEEVYLKDKNSLNYTAKVTRIWESRIKRWLKEEGKYRGRKPVIIPEKEIEAYKKSVKNPYCRSHYLVLRKKGFTNEEIVNKTLKFKK